jgi:hypothetical protein
MKGHRSVENMALIFNHNALKYTKIMQKYFWKADMHTAVSAPPKGLLNYALSRKKQSRLLDMTGIAENSLKSRSKKIWKLVSPMLFVLKYLKEGQSFLRIKSGE